MHGYGTVGSTAAALPHEMGCKVVAASDISGGLYALQSLGIPVLGRHMAEHPRHLLEGWSTPGVESLTNEDLLVHLFKF